MLPASSRSWAYTPILRRAYTTSTTKPELQPPELQITGPEKRRNSVPMISTLRPEKLVYSDFLVLSGRERYQFHTQHSFIAPRPDIRKHNEPSMYMYYRGYMLSSKKYDVESEDGDAGTTASEVANKVEHITVCGPFPEYARGFLYLHQPRPGSGPLGSASSIRFRCVPLLANISSSYVPSPKYVKSLPPRSEPLALLPPSVTNQEIYKAFKAGKDLTFENGVPWGVSILAVVGRSRLEYIRLQLLEDKLFSESDLEAYADIYKDTTNYRRRRLLYNLNDVFPIRFHKMMIEVWTTTEKDGELEVVEKRAARAYFEGVFMDPRSKYGGTLPYTGRALVRFELAPLTDPSKPTLFLRIVKIIEPIECVIPDYDGYVNMPEEGKLVMYGLPGKQRRWSCYLDPLDRDRSAMLALVPGYAVDANS